LCDSIVFQEYDFLIMATVDLQPSPVDVQPSSSDSVLSEELIPEADSTFMEALISRTAAMTDSQVVNEESVLGELFHDKVYLLEILHEMGQESAFTDAVEVGFDALQTKGTDEVMKLTINQFVAVMRRRAKD